MLYAYLFFTAHAATTAASSVTRLQLQHGTEERLGVGGEELDLGIRMEAVEVGALRGQHLIDVRVVTLVVRVGWHREAWGQVKLAL